MRKPYFKKNRNAWYVNHPNGSRIKLATTEDEAWEVWRKLDLGATPEPEPEPEPEPKVEPKPAPVKQTVLTLGRLVADYLEWVSRNREKATLESYIRALQPLTKMHGDLPVIELCPFHLDEVVQVKTNAKAVQAEKDKTGNKSLKVWGQTTCWQLYKATAACLNWAVDQKIIKENPLGKIKEKPTCGVRQDWINQEEFDSLIAACDDPLLTELLTVIWETGARPFEVFQAKAKHLDRQARCLRYARTAGDKVKAKRTNKTATRTVRLSKGAFEICCRLADQRPQGPLFVNSVGAAWTANLVSARMRVLRQRTGLGMRKDTRKITLYTFRHSFCTRLILKGENIRTVQELMGHADLSMIASVYAHLNKENDHLNAALDRLAS